MVINSDIQSKIYKLSNGDSYEIIPRVYMSNTGMYFTLISKNNRVVLAWSPGDGYHDGLYPRGFYIPTKVVYYPAGKFVELFSRGLAPSTLMSRMANNSKKETIFMSSLFDEDRARKILPKKIYEIFMKW